MKQLFLTFISVFSLLVVGMDEPPQLSLLNNSYPAAKDIRRAHIYPKLYIQDLGRLVQVNKQFRGEIGCVSVYQQTDFQGLEEAVRSAWHCYQEDGCHPNVILSFIDVSRHKNVFEVNQEQLIAHWIKRELRSRLWSSEKPFLDSELLKRSRLESFDNNIRLKSANVASAMICIDQHGTKKNDVFNNVMTMYSIDKNDKSLNQEELDLFINKHAEKPVVVVLETSVLKDKNRVDILLKQFEKCENKLCSMRLMVFSQWACSPAIFQQAPILPKIELTIVKCDEYPNIHILQPSIKSPDLTVGAITSLPH